MGPAKPLKGPAHGTHADKRTPKEDRVEGAQCVSGTPTRTPRNTGGGTFMCDTIMTEQNRGSISQQDNVENRKFASTVVTETGETQYECGILRSPIPDERCHFLNGFVYDVVVLASWFRRSPRHPVTAARIDDFEIEVVMQKARLVSRQGRELDPDQVVFLPYADSSPQVFLVHEGYHVGDLFFCLYQRCLFVVQVKHGIVFVGWLYDLDIDQDETVAYGVPDFMCEWGRQWVRFSLTPPSTNVPYGLDAIREPDRDRLEKTRFIEPIRVDPLFLRLVPWFEQRRERYNGYHKAICDAVIETLSPFEY
jgi:hypothetical protein